MELATQPIVGLPERERSAGADRGRGEEVAERPGARRTVGDRSLWLDEAPPPVLFSNLVCERVFHDDDEPLSLSLSLSLSVFLSRSLSF